MEVPTLSALKIEKSEGITRYVNLLAPIGAILISIVVVAFISWPKFNEVMRMRQDNKNLSEFVDKLNSKVQTLQGLDQNKLEEQLQASELLLPSNKDVFLLVRQIEQAAASSGVLMGRVELTPGSISNPSSSGLAGISSEQTAGSPASPDGLNVIPVSLTLTSDYRSLLQFLNNMLSLPRTLELKDLSISSGQNSQISSSVTIEAYWQSLPTELSSIEEPVNLLSDSESARLEKIHLEPVEQIVVVPPVPLGRSDIFAPF